MHACFHKYFNIYQYGFISIYCDIFYRYIDTPNVESMTALLLIIQKPNLTSSHFKKHINGPRKPEARNRTRPSFYACPCLWEIFQTSRQLTPKSVVRSGQNSNLSEILCMSSLPASIKRIGSKTTEKRWRHHFPHYKSMGNCLDLKDS